MSHEAILFTVPLDKGSWRNITRSSANADRHAVWSPDGKQIAWFNDEGGEYGLVIADQLGNNRRRINIPNPTYYFVPAWSPDGKRIAFTDTDYRLLVIDVESGEVSHIDTDRFAHPQRSMNPVWSPDSRWIAYARRLETQLRVIKVHNIDTGKTHQITSRMADSMSPIFDESGKYIYFLGSTDFALNIGWLDMTSYDRPVTRALYVAILDNETPSPFLPESDEEGPDSEDKKKDERQESKEKSADDKDKKTDQSDKDEKEKPTVAVKIDFAGISNRIVDAPGIPQRNYLGLVAGPKGTVFVTEAIENQRGATLHKYSLKEKNAKKFADGIRSVVTSHDRKKILMNSGSSWTTAATASPPKDGGKKAWAEQHPSQGGSSRRMAADVARKLAIHAGFSIC